MQENKPLNQSIDQSIRQMVWREIEFGTVKYEALRLQVLNRADTDKVVSVLCDRHCEVKLLPLAYLPTCNLVPFPPPSWYISTQQFTRIKREWLPVNGVRASINLVKMCVKNLTSTTNSGRTSLTHVLHKIHFMCLFPDVRKSKTGKRLNFVGPIVSKR
jgi:hypothetical protein